MMQTQQQVPGPVSGSFSFNGNLTKEEEEEEEMSNSALSTFKAKEAEIEKKKFEVRERVQAQLGRIQEETKRLADIRKELEGLADPLKKEVNIVRKKIDSVNKQLKPLGHSCQKKEKEYKDALEAFNEKNKEKVQLITRLMEVSGPICQLIMYKILNTKMISIMVSLTEFIKLKQLVSESEKSRMKKLEELSKSLELN
ncbi:uncharacterized protein LOC141666571 isoform X1 [Apium graveolens]|uniref:uncharacterized protein LOC141666571 isoform X1 n=1 Tax=Apium graveolens TaxID=4045 RepID=UPI003D7A9C9C